jgi:microsomal dipeptidase-like Zn-dependent dipeptidase
VSPRLTCDRRVRRSGLARTNRRVALPYLSLSRQRAIALSLAALLVPAALHGQCGSAGYASRTWEAYIDGAREAGCLAPGKGPAKIAACTMSVPAMGLKLLDRMVGWWNSMAEGDWATFGPRRLGPGWEFGTLWGTTGRLFFATAPVQTSTRIDVMKRDGIAPANIVICATTEDGSTREIGRGRFDQGPDNINQTRTFVFTDLASELLSVKIDATDWVPTNRFEYRVRITTEPDTSGVGPVTGFADLHLHQAAELGFGGNNIWGSHTGPPAEALREDALDQTAELALLNGPLQWGLGLHSLPGLVLSEGESRHGTGFPDFDAWPHFNDVTHQQAHEDWLKVAHEGGLNLVVVSAVNFEGFCYGLKALFPRPGDRMGCRDMENVERQIRAFIEMDEKHDWYEIAVHPWHARRIINQGNLAVVISMEVSHLLPPDEGDFGSQLDELWGMGLRTLQLAHETDTPFAGAAPHRALFGVFNTIKWYLARGITGGFATDAEGKNLMGLTDQGRRLVDAMVRRNMLIDVAHLSERSVYDVYQFVANRHAYYPLYDSHTRFESILTEWDLNTQKEFLTTDQQIRLLRRTGGMVGLRTGQNAILTVNGPDSLGVPNDCDGSSKSFAQLVHYGRNAGIPMGFGSDLNGFINQLGPRFGDDACPRGGIRIPYRYESGEFVLGDDGLPIIVDTKAAAADEAGRQRDAQETSKVASCTFGGAREGRPFATHGLRHVGYLPDLLADLEALETPGTEILASSAEAFLRMWERSYDPDRGPIPDGVDLAATIAGSASWSPCAEAGVIALNDMAGAWVRVESNHVPNNGMRILLEGDQATLAAMPPTGDPNFRVGQRLWQDFKPDGTLEVLGSDGSYYPSLLTIEGTDRLHIDVDRDNSPGNDQTWERAGPSIDGVWILRAGPEPANFGLQIQVTGEDGRIRFLPAAMTAPLRVGNLLWRAIRAGGVMEARVDRGYQPARVEVLDQDRLRVRVDLPSGTVEETWIRRGSDAQVAETGDVFLPGVRQRALEIAGAPLAERSIRSVLAMASDSIASPSWGTVELGGESFRFLVLGCRIGSNPGDSLFVSGAGEAPDGRPVEVELERSLEDDRVIERVSILFGRRSAGAVWTATGGGAAAGPGRAGAAPEPPAGDRLFTIDGENLRAEGRFRSSGAGAREGIVEVGCEP